MYGGLSLINTLKILPNPANHIMLSRRLPLSTFFIPRIGQLNPGRGYTHVDFAEPFQYKMFLIVEDAHSKVAYDIHRSNSYTSTGTEQTVTDL